MAKRSPILGYNHNFRHRGRVFHVQTEDSGVDNPHIFTHLFNGGVILNTRKLDYDSSADEDVVKSLMQSQHKAVIKELRAGSFDEKIVAYLGPHPEAAGLSRAETPADLVDEAAAKSAATARTIGALSDIGPRASDVSALIDAIREEEIEAAAAAAEREASSGSQAAVSSTTYVQAGGVAKEAPLAHTGPMRAIGNEGQAKEREESARQRASSEQARRKPSVTTPPRRAPAPASAPAAGRARASNVVVSRPAVIISSPSHVIGKTSDRSPTARGASERVAPAPEERPEGLFGQDLISEKSLDEVILAYLSEDPDGEK